MTLIAAIMDGETVLLGADGETHNQHVRMQVRKLDVLQERPIAWGFSGNESIGLDFGNWLRSRQWSESEDWEGFRHDATEVLGQLNERRRKSAETAGTNVSEEALTDVLIAGFLRSQPGILELESDGGNSLRRMLELAAIGSGKNHAIIVLNTLGILGIIGSMSRLQLLQSIFRVAIRTARDCGPPVRILSITPERVTEVTSAPVDGGSR